jgi:putative transcriptional regulator
MFGRSLTGRLLVASPVLVDPNFDRSVILVLAHGEEGALGVVLNRPSALAVTGALPDSWESLAVPPRVFFVGGPVGGGAAIAIGRVVGPPAGDALEDDGTEANASGWSPVVGRVGTVDLGSGPDELDVPVEAVRVFAGYAGWSAGQLEGEIAARAWFVLDAHPDDALSDDPGALWRAVLRRQRGRLAWVANHPPDPSVN